MASTGLQDKTTAYWQALDREHYIHPFTNHAELAAKGARVIARADGAYLWDSELNEGVLNFAEVSIGYNKIVRTFWLWRNF